MMAENMATKSIVEIMSRAAYRKERELFFGSEIPDSAVDAGWVEMSDQMQATLSALDTAGYAVVPKVQP